MKFIIVFLALIVIAFGQCTLSGNGVLANGQCDGADCCALVQGCSTTAGTDCPFPVCGLGFTYDNRANQCVQYQSPTQTALTHTPYTSFSECRADFARNGADHCFGPLERAYRVCKYNVGLN